MPCARAVASDSEATIVHHAAVCHQLLHVHTPLAAILDELLLASAELRSK